MTHDLLQLTRDVNRLPVIVIRGGDVHGGYDLLCWTAEGAHLLLQVRYAVLDGTLDALFRERYPRFRLTSPALELPGL